MSHYPESLRASGTLTGLDIGVGAGRHTRLLCESGFAATGADTSLVGLRYTCESLAAAGYQPALLLASMVALPFPDETFNAAISYGVFYYGDSATMRRAIGELHRVLKPKGCGFVVVRTIDDFRYGKGEALEPHTFRLTTSETNELGAVMHFLPEGAVQEYFKAFAFVEFEKTESTFGNRTCVNSDWLITVRK